MEKILCLVAAVFWLFLPFWIASHVFVEFHWWTVPAGILMLITWIAGGVALGEIADF